MSAKKRAPSTSAKSLQTLQGDSRPFFREQVLRLAATQYFPALDPGVKELIDSLIRVSAGNQERARAIIDRALRSRTCPTPADFEILSSEVGQVTELPKGCDQCDGTGWRYAKRKVIDPITREPYEADCRERCTCPLGKHLRLRESERKSLDQQKGVA